MAKSGINKVLIAGGTGFVGSFIQKQLLAKGIKACLVSRMPRPDSITWDDINRKGIPKGTNAVINVAGQNVLDATRRWTAGFKQNVIASRVHTNEMLSKAITKCQEKPEVFITMSGVGYYEPHQSKIYDEFSVGGNHDFLSRLCQDWENAAKLNTDVRHVAVRSGIVLGKNGGIIQQMYPLFILGLGAKVGSGMQYMPWIHIEDLCNIFLRAIHNDQFSGPINGVAPQIVTNGEFTKTFAKVLKRPTILFLPEPLLDLVFSPERSVMMTKGQKVESKRMNELGYQIKFPTLEEAMKDVLKK